MHQQQQQQQQQQKRHHQRGGAGAGAGAGGQQTATTVPAPPVDHVVPQLHNHNQQQHHAIIGVADNNNKSLLFNSSSSSSSSLEDHHQNRLADRRKSTGAFFFSNPTTTATTATTTGEMQLQQHHSHLHPANYNNNNNHLYINHHQNNNNNNQQHNNNNNNINVNYGNNNNNGSAGTLARSINPLSLSERTTGTLGRSGRTPSSHPSFRRGTLSRPERQRRVRSMLRSASAGPPSARRGATTSRSMSAGPDDFGDMEDEDAGRCKCNWWVWFSRVVTFCCIPPMLSAICGKTNPAVQQAWREKVALCIVILVWCFFVGFLTFGLRLTLCPMAPEDAIRYFAAPGVRQQFPSSVLISGYSYDYKKVAAALVPFKIALTPDWRGHDITALFRPYPTDYCSQFLHGQPFNCTITSPNKNSTLPAPGIACPEFQALVGIPHSKVYFDWADIHNRTDSQMFVAFNGIVMNPTDFIKSPTRSNLFPEGSLPMTALLESVGGDGTRWFYYNQQTLNAANCLASRFTVGFVDKITPGCFTTDLILNISLVTILSLVMARFIVALTFYWCLSHRLSKPPKGIVVKLDNEGNEVAVDSGRVNPVTLIMDEREAPYAMVLVTCYSEGEQSIRNTLESLAVTDYHDTRKLLFVVCDGLITGSGNAKSTPEIVLDMIEADHSLPPPTPRSYISIAEGSKQHNMAYVHAGYYVSNGHRVPTIVVVKCGTIHESTSKKPGNRGKRDSQLVLMNFLSRCVFDDLMTPLDFELFTRITHIANATPDVFEYILMVDADTKVDPASLTHMITAMKSDVNIMGLCGETRISNKTSSWVSMIQVFEYYISHHLGKAFESAFGGVTCLPGCFCMYRVKAPKGPEGYFVPILVNPDIVEEYSENVVDTLHKKNLLLLGEDRFLTTLLLRNFPKRKMVFVPKAMCWTVVPDEFRVLLSQRRRWINSTIHNLLELVLVRDLCGVFCFSMQFVVLLELIGTIVLPAAIAFTFYLIIKLCISGIVDMIPIMMLIAILGLPGFLIVITSGKLVYVGWMVVYLLALPIWNFILPVYAFWHFDDFSWGETRKVEGESKGDTGGHGTKEGTFDPDEVTLMRWEDWERDRRAAEADRAKGRRKLAPQQQPPMSPPPPSAALQGLNRMVMDIVPPPA